MFGQFKSKHARKQTNDIGITEDVAHRNWIGNKKKTQKIQYHYMKDCCLNTNRKTMPQCDP